MSAFQQLKSTSAFGEFSKDCLEMFTYIDYYSIYIKHFQRYPYLLLLIGVCVIPFAFLNIKFNADQFVSTAIVRIQTKLGISSLVAAFTLLPLANGAPDIITTFVSATSGESGGDVAVGSLVSSFVFASSIVLAYVIVCSGKKAVVVPAATVAKEIGFCGLMYAIVIGLALYGRTQKYFSVVTLGVFVAYIVVSTHLARRDTAPEERSMQESKSGLDSLAHFGLVSSLLDYLYDSEQPLSSVLLFPFKLVYLFTVPNVENPFAGSFVHYLVLALASVLFNLAMGVTRSPVVLLCAALAVAAGTFVLMQLSFVSKHRVLLFDTFTLVAAIAWMKVFSTLLLDSINLLSFVLGIGRTFLSLIILSLGNSMPDFFANGAIAATGESVMALVGCLSSQFANFTLGVSIYILFNAQGQFDLFGLRRVHASAEKNLMKLIFLFAVGSLACLALHFGLTRGFTRSYVSVCAFFYTCFLLITGVYAFSGR